MRSFLVRKIKNFTKTLSLCAKVPNTYGARLYSSTIDEYVNYMADKNFANTCTNYTCINALKRHNVHADVGAACRAHFVLYARHKFDGRH